MIRHAEPTDKVAVITLLKQSHKAAGFDTPGGFSFPFDPAYAERLFFVHLMPRHVCLLLDAEGAIGGVLMASHAEHPFGPVKVARETVWFINRHYRGLGAVKMLDAYEVWARANQCEFVGMAGMGEDPEVGKLYQRRGFMAAERHFLKAIT